nr:MAG TPA: hypothetical protein [Caudoviricetes sp.]
MDCGVPLMGTLRNLSSGGCIVSNDYTSHFSSSSVS